MSLSRWFMNDLRPFFRMLDEPLAQAGYWPRHMRGQRFQDPFFGSFNAVRPAVDLVEEAEGFRIEAELPGVKKGQVQVNIGDGGRSVTIESTVESSYEGPRSVDHGDQPRQENTNNLSSERSFTSRTSFHRTVWLPRPVDAAGVKAKLEDGILTVQIPKAKEDRGNIKVTVE